MKYLLILLLIVFPFGQLLRFDLGMGVAIHINDLLVGIIGLIGIYKGIKSKNKLKRPILIWILAMGFSLAINVKNYPLPQILISSLYFFRWTCYAGLFFFFINFKEKEFIKRGLFFAALAVAVAGIVQYLLVPDVSFLAASDWDNHYFRLVSTFLDPGFSGAILVLGLLIEANPIIFTALLFTYSRASYLLYVVSFSALAYYKKSLKILVISLAVLLISITLLPVTPGEGTKLAREASTWSRIKNWEQGLIVWQKSPIFGVGFDAYRYVSNASVKSHAGAGVDSSFILVLATTGVVGLLAYINLLKGMWFFSKKNTLFKITFLGILVHSWFNNTLFYPWVMEWLWLLLIL